MEYSASSERNLVGFPSLDEAMANSGDFGGIPRNWLEGLENDEYLSKQRLVKKWFEEGKTKATGAAILRRMLGLCERRRGKSVADGTPKASTAWAADKLDASTRSSTFTVKWAAKDPVWILPVSGGRDTVTSDAYAAMESSGWRLWVLVDTEPLEEGKLTWGPSKLIGHRASYERVGVLPWIVLYHEFGHCIQALTNLRRYLAMSELDEEGVNNYMLDFENLQLHEYPMCDEEKIAHRELYEELTPGSAPYKLNGIKSAIIQERKELLQGFNDVTVWGDTPQVLD